MIITNYKNFLNEAEVVAQGQPATTTEEKPKVSEEAVVANINSLIQKLKDKMKEKSKSTGEELVVGQKYTYKPEDADAYDVTISGITDDKYICIRETDKKTINISKKRKSQFTKIETKAEPKKESIELGTVYSYDATGSHKGGLNYLLLSYAKDSDNKLITSIQLNDPIKPGNISVSNLVKKEGVFTDIIWKKINSADFLSKDLKEIKKMKLLIKLYDQYQDQYKEEFNKSSVILGKIETKLNEFEKPFIEEEEKKAEATKTPTNPTNKVDNTNKTPPAKGGVVTKINPSK